MWANRFDMPAPVGAGFCGRCCARVMEDGQVRRPVTGSPQGGVISPLLCNVYLHRLDRAWDVREHGVLARLSWEDSGAHLDILRPA